MTRTQAAIMGVLFGLLIVFVVFKDIALYGDAQKCLTVGGVPVLTWGPGNMHARKVACVKAASLQYVPM